MVHTGKRIAAPALAIGAIDMALRGLDYSTGDDPKTGVYLTRIELGLTLEWWGVLFILAAGAVIAGLVWQQTALQSSGAAMAAVLYSFLAVGRALEVYHGGWPPDGWRSAVHFACIGLIWAYASYQLAIRDAVERAREERRRDRARRIAENTA